MNKKLFLILLSLLTFFSVYAVRFNEKGEKMIKEFTYHTRDGLRNRFVYDYDDSGKMRSLTVYGQRNTIEAIYYKEGDELKATREEKCEINIKLNEKGKVKLIENFTLDDDNNKVYKYSFLLDYICDNGIDRLDQLKYSTYYYDKIMKKFAPFPHESTFKAVNNKGLYQSDNDWSYEPDLEHPNDTNVSFCGIINPSVIMSSTDIYHLRLTEWIDIKSPYFAYYSPSDYYITNYSYDDDGNIIQIRKIRNNKYLEAEVNIKYVE